MSVRRTDIPHHVKGCFRSIYSVFDQIHMLKKSDIFLESLSIALYFFLSSISVTNYSPQFPCVRSVMHSFI